MHFCCPTLGVEQLFLHWYVFKIEIFFINFWILNLCVCVHIKVGLK
jgi:hypothetical protein